jgi:hypothetical protein
MSRVRIALPASLADRLPVTLVMVCVSGFVLLLAMTQSALTLAMVMRLLTVATVLLLFVTVFWLIYRR